MSNCEQTSRDQVAFGLFMLAVLTVSFLAIGQWAFRYADAKARADKAESDYNSYCAEHSGMEVK